MTLLETSISGTEAPGPDRRQPAVTSMPLAWAALTTISLTVLAVVYSGTLSENFTDLTTGSMAFTGIGDKSVEIFGAVAAVVLGGIVGFLATRIRSRRDMLPIIRNPEGADSFTPKPFIVLVVCILAVASVSLGTRTVLAAAGIEAGPWTWPIVLAPFIGGLIWLRHQGRSKASLSASILVAAQSTIGASAFALLPATDAKTVGALSGWTTPAAWLSTTTVAAIVLAAGLRRLRWLLSGSNPSSRTVVIGPAVVVAAVALSGTVGPPVIPWDGYHFGELVSPSYLADTWGQMPFINQFPARGILVNYAPSWLSNIFAAPGAGLIGFGHAWISLAITALAYFLAARHLPVTATLMITATTAFASANLMAIGDVTMILLLALIYQISQWSHGLAWPAGVLLGVIAILAAPAQGLACVVAILALACIRLSVGHRPSPSSLVGILSAAGLAITVASLEQVRNALTAAVGYVESQGSVNDQVWGTPWIWSLQVQAHTYAGAPFLELARAAVLPMLAVLISLTLVRVSHEGMRTTGLAITVAIIAYLTLQLPRALGRIDPDGISRVGALTLVTAGIALPLIAAHTRMFVWTRATTLAASVIVVPLILLDGGVAKAALFAGRTVTTTDPSNAGTLVQAQGRFGNAMIDPVLLAEYTTLSAQFHELPGAVDGLLDLTNDQADFRYLGASNSLSYGAAYNITSSSVEASEVDRLSFHPPRVSLLSTNLSSWNDGGSLGLRTPNLYRWVLERYVPVQCGTPGQPGFAIWGTTDGTAPNGCKRARSHSETVEFFNRALSPPLNLGALARSWGSARAEAINEQLVRPRGAPLRIHQNAQHIDVHITAPVAGARNDVLTLDLDCGGWRSGVITWFDRENPIPHFAFVDLGGGRAILPMGSFPDFALRTAPLDVVVQLDTEGGCRSAVQATWSERAATP